MQKQYDFSRVFKYNGYHTTYQIDQTQHNAHHETKNGIFLKQDYNNFKCINIAVKLALSSN